LELFSQKAKFKERVKRLGIIRDAEDSSAAAAFQSVRAALDAAKMAVPTQLTGLEGSPVAVGVFILPNCNDSGMLETLCLQAIEEKEKAQPNAVLPCVDDFFACLDKRGRKPVNPLKARFAGFALGRDVIDPQLGRAAQQGTIPWDAKVFDHLNAFLRSITGP
jgi:hypothetical protein